MSAPAATGGEDPSTRFQKRPEPPTRPVDPSWRWNGYYWRFPLADLEVTIHARDNDSSFYANVEGVFCLSGPERADGESAATDSIRMIDYVRALQSEVANRVVVPPTVKSRRVKPPR